VDALNRHARGELGIEGSSVRRLPFKSELRNQVHATFMQSAALHRT
jgi:hypothetical protein